MNVVAARGALTSAADAGVVKVKLQSAGELIEAAAAKRAAVKFASMKLKRFVCRLGSNWRPRGQQPRLCTPHFCTYSPRGHRLEPVGRR